MGGMYTPIMKYFDSGSSRYEKDLLSVLSKSSREALIEILNQVGFFHGSPKGGWYFSYIMTKANRLSNLHGPGTLYV